MTRIDQLIIDQKASINFFNPIAMIVNISQPEENQYIVNGKLIYKDSTNNWIAKDELTTGETKAFRLHLSKVTGECVINKRP